MAGIDIEDRALPADWLVPVPDELSDGEAATLPCAGLTAWSAIQMPTPLQSGDTVLVLGTGGVALFAMQIAIAIGARAIAMTSSQAKESALTPLGVDHVVLYDPATAWHHRVRSLTDGRGVDLVVETIGAPTIEQSMLSLAFGGQAAVVGVFDGHVGTLGTPPAKLMVPRVLTGTPYHMRGVAVGSRNDLEAFGKFVVDRGVQTVIDAVYDFGHAIDAYRYFDALRHVGKVVITC